MSRTGRPTKLNDEIAEYIFEQLANGNSLNQICADPDMPTRRTVHNWIVKNEDFFHKYARAREVQADYFADQIAHIAMSTDSESANANRVKMDACKWLAGKLRPKVWGDSSKLDVEHSGKAEIEVRFVKADGEQFQGYE